MTVNISDRDKKILIVLLGILILGAVFIFVFKPASEERENLKLKATQLNNEYSRLSQLAAKSDDYEAKIAEDNNNCQDILSHFPVYRQAEDELMDICKYEDASGSDISVVTIGDPYAIDPENPDGDDTSSSSSSSDSSQSTESTESTQTTESQTTEATTDSSSDSSTSGSNYSSWQLYGIDTVLECSTGYDGLKTLLNKIAKSDNRKCVAAVNLTYDTDSGSITGEIGFASYFIYGLDKAYDPEHIPSTKHGTENPFGTVN